MLKETSTSEMKKKMDVLQNDLIKMGRLVQSAYMKFRDAYFYKDEILTKEIFKLDNSLDFLEMEITYRIINIISISHFLGKKVRLLSAILRISRILENLGDICEEMAKRNLNLLFLPQSINSENFEDIFDISYQMLNDTLNYLPFIFESSIPKVSPLKMAKKICLMDSEVDELYNGYRRQLMKKVTNETAEEIFLHLEILTNVERFADLTTNIMEDIIFTLYFEGYKCRKKNLEIFYTAEETDW